MFEVPLLEDTHRCQGVGGQVVTPKGQHGVAGRDRSDLHADGCGHYVTLLAEPTRLLTEGAHPCGSGHSVLPTDTSAVGHLW